MKLTNMKLTGLFAAIVLIFCSFGAYAEESQEATPPMNKDQVGEHAKLGETKQQP